MQINYLSLNNFRNHGSSEFDFEPGFNLLIGSNGQGKTNAVESIMFLATQSSHRTSNQKALIKSDSTESIIRAKLLNGDRTALVETQVHAKGANKYFLNKQNVSARDIQRVINAIIFAPEDLNIVRGDPAARRKFIDEVLMMRYPAAIPSISEYERTVKQKNSLLKTLKKSKDKSNLRSTLSLWNEKLADLGTNIIYYRRQAVVDLLPLVNSAYDQIAGVKSKASIYLNETFINDDVSRETNSKIDENFDLRNSHVSRETIKAAFLETISSVQEAEEERGQTLVGPHRDDISFTLNDLPVKGYASHGETWSFVLSLKLSVARLIAAESNMGDPIIILDDVFAELDRNRQYRLVEEIKDFQQVIVTAAVLEDVPQLIDTKTFRISAGQVSLH